MGPQQAVYIKPPCDVEMQRDCRDRQAQEDQREGWNLVNGYAREKERATPDEAEQEQEAPG